MDEIVIQNATDEDAAEILVLQRCCWVSEAISNNSMDIPRSTRTYPRSEPGFRSRRSGPHDAAAGSSGPSAAQPTEPHCR